jgi:hypothetical protein
MTDPVDRGRNRSETFAEFARAEGFYLSTFYKLKKLGLGPDVLHVPGTRIERITPEARQALARAHGRAGKERNRATGS